MSFPFNNGGNGDAAAAMRRSNNLRNSLASVLGEVVSTDLFLPTAAAVPAAQSTFVSSVVQQNHLSSSRSGSVAAASLPTLAQSLGLAAAPAAPQAAAPRTDILLEALNAASAHSSSSSPAASSLLDQVKASLIDQAIAKEKTRILNDLYLGLLLRKQVAAAAAAATPLPPPAAAVASASAPLTSTTTTTTFQQQQEQPIMSARRVADSIGCQLRAGKPYIDVTTLPGLEEETGGRMMMAPRRNRGGVTESFPEKVHRMLKETSKDAKLSSIVAFLPHGRAFMVYDIDEFVATILPKYFKQSKWNSFARQLNLYGFLRLTNRGPDSGAYYHELFLRGRPTLCLHMRRVGVPRQDTDRRKHKAATTALPQPDFYAMKPLPPTCEEEERTEKITSSSTS